jgi:hypothetical protein
MWPKGKKANDHVCLKQRVSCFNNAEETNCLSEYARTVKQNGFQVEGAVHILRYEQRQQV